MPLMLSTSLRHSSPLLGPAGSSPLSIGPGQAFLFIAALVGALLITTPTAHAAATDADLAWKYHCVTCHGQTGVANSDRYPNLAGQNVIYLEARLKSFRAREEHRNQMNAQALPLSDEDIVRLAGYFSRRGAEAAE